MNDSDRRYSASFDEALILAAAVHQDQERKGTQIPYITHPVQVARILDRSGYGEEVVLAGLLHDVLEDIKPDDQALRNRIRAVVKQLRNLPDEPGAARGAVRDYIREAFGSEVLRLVEAVTEQKKDDRGEERPWRERKLESLRILQSAGRNLAALKAADLLHNVSSVTRDLRKEGPTAMRRFKVGANDTLWWYRTASSTAIERLGATEPLAVELAQAVGKLEQAMEETGASRPPA